MTTLRFLIFVAAEINMKYGLKLACTKCMCSWVLNAHLWLTVLKESQKIHEVLPTIRETAFWYLLKGSVNFAFHLE